MRLTAMSREKQALILHLWENCTQALQINKEQLKLPFDFWDAEDEYPDDMPVWMNKLHERLLRLEKYSVNLTRSLQLADEKFRAGRQAELSVLDYHLFLYYILNVHRDLSEHAIREPATIELTKKLQAVLQQEPEINGDIEQLYTCPTNLFNKARGWAQFKEGIRNTVFFAATGGMGVFGLSLLIIGIAVLTGAIPFAPLIIAGVGILAALVTASILLIGALYQAGEYAGWATKSYDALEQAIIEEVAVEATPSVTSHFVIPALAERKEGSPELQEQVDVADISADESISPRVSEQASPQLQVAFEYSPWIVSRI